MLSLATVVSAVASLNVALPSIARDTRATQTQLSWIIDAYALVFAALLLLGGAIGDRYGRRRALIAGLVIFGGGSAAAMGVSDPGWLIAMRGVMGLGASLVMPATLSTITSTFPGEQRTRAVGAWAGVAGASAILGLLASGLLLEVWSWRSVFGFNLVLATVAIVGTARFIPESADSTAPRRGRARHRDQRRDGGQRGVRRQQRRQPTSRRNPGAVGPPRRGVRPQRRHHPVRVRQAQQPGEGPALVAIESALPRT